MGENSTTAETAPRLAFKVAGLTGDEAVSGATAYEATAEGVTYRVVGTIIPGTLPGRRAFTTTRMVNSHRGAPAAEGGQHKTRAAAYAQAERDLADVLRDREAAAKRRESPRIVADPISKPALDAQRAGRALRPEPEPLRDVVNTNGDTFSVGDRVTFPGPVCEDGDRWRIDRLWLREVNREPIAALRLVYRRGGLPLGETSAAVQVDRLVPVIELADLEPGPFRRIEAAVEQIEQVVRELTATPPPAQPVLDKVPDLLDRAVHRAQYEALKAVLVVLAGWIERVDDDNDGFFHTDDIRRMINDAARELGVAEPWRGGPDA